MHVCILGAGIMGVSTAYYLAKAGCKVTVFDRQSSAAGEASYGGGGLSPVNFAQTIGSFCPRLMQYSKECAKYLGLPAHFSSYETTHFLLQKSRQLGVRFRFGYALDGWHTRGGRMVSAHLSATPPRQTGNTFCHADHFVIAMGMRSAQALKSLRILLPLTGIKGFTFTVNPYARSALFDKNQTWIDMQQGLIATLREHTLKIVMFSPKGQLFDNHLDSDQRVRHKLRVIASSLGATHPQIEMGSFWAGVASATHDGRPFIGPTHLTNLSLNVGHGLFGASMACGAAQVLADRILKQDTLIDIRAYDPHRPIQPIQPNMDTSHNTHANKG